MAIPNNDRKMGIVKVNPDGTSRLLTTQREINDYYESLKNDGQGPMPFIDPEIGKQLTSGLDSALESGKQIRSVENPLSKILEVASNYKPKQQTSVSKSVQNKSVENPLIGILEAARNYKPKQVEINTSPFATEDETRRMYTDGMMKNENRKEIEEGMIKSYNLNPNLDTVVWPGKKSQSDYTGYLRNNSGTFDLPVSTDPWMTPEEIAARNITIPYRAGAEIYPQLDNNGKIVKPKANKSAESGSVFKGNRSVPSALPEVITDNQSQSQGRTPADDNVFTRVDLSPLQRLIDVQESKQAVENNRQAPATFQDPNNRFLSAEELNALRTRTQMSKLESALASEKLRADVDAALRSNAVNELQAMLTGRHYDQSNAVANRKIDSDERMKAAELAAERAKKKAEAETDYLQKLAPYYSDYQKSGIPSKRPRTTDEFVGGIAEMTNKYRQLDEELNLQRKMNQIPELDIALKMHEIKNRGR